MLLYLKKFLRKLYYFLFEILVIKTTGDLFNSHSARNIPSDSLELTNKEKIISTSDSINKPINEQNNYQDHILNPFSGLNNLDSFQSNSSIFQKIFDNTNNFKTDSNKLIQQIKINEEKRLYKIQREDSSTLLFNFNPSNDIQLESKEFKSNNTINNTPNYNIEGSVNNIIYNEVTNNITIYSEEKYNNLTTKYINSDINLLNKNILKNNTNYEYEAKLKRQKYEETYNINRIENIELDDSYKEDINDIKELISLSYDEINEFFENEEISNSEILKESKSLLIEKEKIKIKEKNLFKTNSIESINPLIQNNSINNNEESIEEEKVNWYFIDFNNENIEIKPLFILKKDIEKKLLKKNKKNEDREFSFFFS